MPGRNPKKRKIYFHEQDPDFQRKRTEAIQKVFSIENLDSKGIMDLMEALLKAFDYPSYHEIPDAEGKMWMVHPIREIFESRTRTELYKDSKLSQIFLEPLIKSFFIQGPEIKKQKFNDALTQIKSNLNIPTEEALEKVKKSLELIQKNAEELNEKINEIREKQNKERLSEHDNLIASNAVDALAHLLTEYLSLTFFFDFFKKKL
ncbi:MAG TPA: hypothetical protein VJK05_03300 [archaeon]|nr:hypothetical protein [archaeon]